MFVIRFVPSTEYQLDVILGYCRNKAFISYFFENQVYCDDFIKSWFMTMADFCYIFSNCVWVSDGTGIHPMFLMQCCYWSTTTSLIMFKNLPNKMTKGLKFIASFARYRRSCRGKEILMGRTILCHRSNKEFFFYKFKVWFSFFFL